MAAAAQSEREQIGHSEERANAADLDDVVGLARKAVTEGADVGRRAADVDDERVAEPREKGRAAHAVGRPGRERVHRIRLGDVRQHHGTVVLREIERRRDAARP